MLLLATSFSWWLAASLNSNQPASAGFPDVEKWA
jgi:hypothetical protein